MQIISPTLIGNKIPDSLLKLLSVNNKIPDSNGNINILASDLGLNSVLIFKGNVATSTDLNNVMNPEIGDVYLVVDENRLHSYIGNSTWVDMGENEINMDEYRKISDDTLIHQQLLQQAAEYTDEQVQTRIDAESDPVYVADKPSIVTEEILDAELAKLPIYIKDTKYVSATLSNPDDILEVSYADLSFAIVKQSNTNDAGFCVRTSLQGTTAIVNAGFGQIYGAAEQQNFWPNMAISDQYPNANSMIAGQNGCIDLDLGYSEGGVSRYYVTDTETMNSYMIYISTWGNTLGDVDFAWMYATALHDNLEVLEGNRLDMSKYVTVDDIIRLTAPNIPQTTLAQIGEYRQGQLVYIQDVQNQFSPTEGSLVLINSPDSETPYEGITLYQEMEAHRQGDLKRWDYVNTLEARIIELEAKTQDKVVGVPGDITSPYTVTNELGGVVSWDWIAVVLSFGTISVNGEIVKSSNGLDLVTISHDQIAVKNGDIIETSALGVINLEFAPFIAV